MDSRKITVAAGILLVVSTVFRNMRSLDALLLLSLATVAVLGASAAVARFERSPIERKGPVLTAKR